MKYNEYPFINVPGTNNAEIEDKETILLPDGRSYSVNGKKHSEGGIDVMLPTGTKVFSDYLKLPKKTVGSLLDTENNKKKMSPADIVKQYDTLPYHDILNSNSNRYNSMAKRTANAMIMKLNALHDDVFMAQEEYKKEQGIDKETPIMQDGGLYEPEEVSDPNKGLYDFVEYFDPESIPGYNPKNDAVFDRQSAKEGEIKPYAPVPLDSFHSFSKPQVLMMKPITGRYEYPSDALQRNGFVNPTLHGAVDFAADPMTHVGGALKYLKKIGPAINAAVNYYTPKEEKQDNSSLYDFVEYEDGGQHLPQYQMGELTDYPEDPLLTLMNNIYGQYNSQDNLVEELPGYVFNNTNNLSTDPVTVPQYNKDIYKKGEQPRMSPEIIKTLNNNEYKFEVNDPYNAIPSTQRSNKDGTYGEQVSYEDFTNNNSWYDFSNFDIKNKDNVADFQSGYNEQLTNMAESFGMTPEQLIKEIGFSGNRGTKSLDGLGGEYTLTRKLPSKIPVPVTSIATPPNPVIKESEPIKLPLPKSAKPVTTPAPRGISQRDYINGIQNGLVLSELAALDIDNPYYSFSPSQVATTRYEPVNTKQSERAFNIAKESIENSNLPESVKMAQLAQMQGNLLSGINQVDITNAQNNLQNQNQNTSNLLNTLNNDSQKREQSNMNYVRDRAIGREAFDMTRNEMIGSVLNNWKASVKNKRDEELMSMLSNNYDLVDGKPVYVEGRGYVNNYENLDNYNKVYSLDENIAMVQDRLDKLLKKKKQGK